MGLGGAGAAWGDDFIQRIEAQGFELMVIDNRDTGGSDLFNNWGTPTIWWQILKYELGFSVDAPYTLRDMASDSVAVLDAEGHDQVHVMGVSMGGMIAQVIAAQHPERVQTLTSIMSTTFAPHLPPPSRAAEDELRDLAGGDAELSREAKCVREVFTRIPWSVISWLFLSPAIGRGRCRLYRRPHWCFTAQRIHLCHRRMACTRRSKLRGHDLSCLTAWDTTCQMSFMIKL